MRKMLLKRIASFLVLCHLLIFYPVINCNASDLQFDLYATESFVNIEFYTVGQVQNSLETYSKTGKKDDVLKSIIKPTSLGITVPNLDMDRIVNDTSYIERYNQPLTDTEIHIAVEKYDVLKNHDLSKWTYGMYVYRTNIIKKEQLIFEITQNYIQLLIDRQILPEDVLYIIDSGYSMQDIFSMSDSMLRCLIEDGYKRKSLNIIYDSDLRIRFNDDKLNLDSDLIKCFFIPESIDGIDISLSLYNTHQPQSLINPRLFTPIKTHTVVIPPSQRIFPLLI